jgi:hypothetical protein
MIPAYPWRGRRLPNFQKLAKSLRISLSHDFGLGRLTGLVPPLPAEHHQVVLIESGGNLDLSGRLHPDGDLALFNYVLLV